MYLAWDCAKAANLSPTLPGRLLPFSCRETFRFNKDIPQTTPTDSKNSLYIRMNEVFEKENKIRPIWRAKIKPTLKPPGGMGHHTQ